LTKNREKEMPSKALVSRGELDWSRRKSENLAENVALGSDRIRDNNGKIIQALMQTTERVPWATPHNIGDE